jgi:phosphatidylserine/phosphatidylglycerophosphate/cardiolipin synthase-like enzyme
MLRELCAWVNADAGYTMATIQDDTLMVHPKNSAEAKEFFDDLAEGESQLEGLTEGSPDELSLDTEQEWEDSELEGRDISEEAFLEERFDPSAAPKDVADALSKKDWPLALRLAIQVGWRDENELTNLIFFARHPELPPEQLDPKGPNFKQLSGEWSRILDHEVWKAIAASAENTNLVVSGKEVTDHHWRFFRGKNGKRLKKLVEDAAREVDLNPGLLGTIMMAETRRPQSYLSSEKVSSYHIGTDDFYEGRAAIKARVPAYAKVGWDRNQTPVVHDNDSLSCKKKAAGDKALFEKYSKLCRQVKTILFDSSPDAVLATAVYVKFREVRLREIAAELKGDFDSLPLPTRFALTRMAMAAGIGGATPFLKDALNGKDIFIRKAIPVRAYQTKRNATVRTAQAMHLSDWIFGIPVPPAAAQPELEILDDFNVHESEDEEFEVNEFHDEAEASSEDIDPELDEEVEHPDHETEDDEGPAEMGGELEEEISRDDPYPLGVELEENEFRLDRLPAKAQQHFSKGGAAWRDAVAEAIRAGIRNPSDLADLIFFMQNPTRMTARVGKPINKREPDFFKLRAEWNLYRTIATGLLKPAAAKPTCAVFLPANPSRNYENYVAAPTTGRITLMINGKSSGVDQTEAFDSMQKTVESLGPNDSIFLANWQFTPTDVHLTVRRPGMKTWGDLFKSKAKDGVKIRIIISVLPQLASRFQTNLSPLNKIISDLPSSARDNLKYIASQHPANLLGSHHQKFMVVRKGRTTIGYCGGLDISFNRTPDKTPAGWGGWGSNFVWHDIHAKLEGLIVRDLEKEFVLRWNREKDESTASKLPGWKGFETLAQASVTSVDREADKNTHKLQMLRTVSIGTNAQDIRRDDIWQGYFRLIGCATRFIFMENQYFHEPKMADAIVKQAQAQSDLIVIIVVTSKSDDPDNVFTEHCLALRHEFFRRLFAGLPPSRLRVYTKFVAMVHSKLILVDDQVLSMGSANANPRGFFLDTELNVMLDDAEAVTRFRHRLWSHDLGVTEESVATWAVSDFIAKWDAVAKANEGKIKTPDQMTGEGFIPFGPRNVKGARSRLIQDVWC